MSDVPTEDIPELKAGHPPAMKVGGMRVPQPKHVPHEPAPPAAKEEEEVNEEASKNHNRKVVISGAVVKEKDIYSPNAAKAIHEKPGPTRTQNTCGHLPGPPNYVQSMANLQQPRRN